MQPICHIPIVSNAIPFCAAAPPPLDLARVTASQNQLEEVMQPAGQNRDLAREMIGHEYAVRDLKTRVAASDLRRKRELEEQFSLLIRRTKDAARGLSRFTAKVSKSIDAVITIDEHVVKKLEMAADRQNQPRRLSSVAFTILNPVSAFRSDTNGLSTEQLKTVFLTSTSRIAFELQPLISEAFELRTALDTIQGNLDMIQELAVDEMGDLPRMDILERLWTRLARADDYAQYQSHKELLRDLMVFYRNAGEVMKVTGYALDRADHELGEFRDEFAAPGLTMKDEPPELVVGRMRSSIRRLQSGRQAMDGIEGI